MKINVKDEIDNKKEEYATTYNEDESYYESTSNFTFSYDGTSNIDESKNDNKSKSIKEIRASSTKDVIVELNLPNTRIYDVEQNNKEEYIIKVTSTIEGTKCNKCGQFASNYHKLGHEITLRDLSICGKKVFIKLNPIQYKCKRCNSVNTQKVNWYLQRSPNTLRYENHILRQLVNSTISDVSIKDDFAYDKIVGVMERHLKSEVNWDEYEKIPTLGIDEISSLKGRGKFFLIITTLIDNKVKILAVLKDRKKQTLVNFLKKIPENLKKTINTACTDMWEGYINAIEEEFNSEKQQVKVVIDRFHVAKNYRKCLDDVRKVEMKRLQKELNKSDYEKLKNIHWILRKKREDLTDSEKEKLTYLFSLSSEIKKVYDFTYELTDIFNEKKLNKEEGTDKIRKWIEKVNESDVKCFETFINTLTKHMDKIANYFIKRESSGFVEGLNNKLKVIKRQCYGLRNVGNFFRRIYLSLEGYARFI